MSRLVKKLIRSSTDITGSLIEDYCSNEHKITNDEFQ